MVDVEQQREPFFFARLGSRTQGWNVGRYTSIGPLVARECWRLGSRNGTWLLRLLLMLLRVLLYLAALLRSSLGHLMR